MLKYENRHEETDIIQVLFSQFISVRCNGHLFSRPYTWPYTNDKYITLTKLYEKAARIQNTCAMVEVTKKEIKLWEEQDSGD
mgnify:CR=1 FL=1